MDKNLLKCKYCGRVFSHLGAHIWHGHGVLAREYKEEFGLPYKMSLISDEVKRKKQESFEPSREKVTKNLIKEGKKHQFKKGQTGQRRISEHERQTNLKRILEVNDKHKKLQPCPVCRMQFSHVESHMYRVHGLLKIKNLKINK